MHKQDIEELEKEIKQIQEQLNDINENLRALIWYYRLNNNNLDK